MITELIFRLQKDVLFYLLLLKTFDVIRIIIYNIETNIDGRPNVFTNFHAQTENK